VKLAAFYAIVAVAYGMLAVSDPVQAERWFPWVAVLLLAPAVYAEVLRVRRNR
jgi:hypothetical protein